MIVESLQLEDIVEVEELISSYHKESIYSSVKYNKAKVTSFLLESYLNNSGYARIIRDGNKVVGIHLAYMEELFFSQEKIASDFMLYVLPEYRGKWLGVKFVNALIGWARMNHISLVQIGTISGINTERTISLYNKKWGFKSIGGTMSLEI